MSDNRLKFITTADGSKTIYNAQVGENYHSRHGALQESEHVFLNSGLAHYLSLNTVKSVTILEVGFGTGLNFLLTADYCTQNQITLDYTGIEAYPLTDEMLVGTEYDRYVSEPIWQSFIGHYPDALQQTIQLNELCRLQIAHIELLNFNSPQLYDVIYFDAFASVHQPEMWDVEAMSHTVKHLKPGGVFVTYAITGNLKRILKGFGLKVEKAPGAPGKREMLRAINPVEL